RVGFPCAPCARIKDSGDTPMVKSGWEPAVTVKVTVVVSVTPPPVPVIVIGYMPTVVVVDTVIVAVELPAPGAGIVLGLKLTVVPLGTPDADKAMALLYPLSIVVVTVVVPTVP